MGILGPSFSAWSSASSPSSCIRQRKTWASSPPSCSASPVPSCRVDQPVPRLVQSRRRRRLHRLGHRRHHSPGRHGKIRAGRPRDPPPFPPRRCLLIGGLALPAAAGTLVNWRPTPAARPPTTWPRRFSSPKRLAPIPANWPAGSMAKSPKGCASANPSPASPSRPATSAATRFTEKGRGIESWRMRAELLVESRDPRPWPTSLAVSRPGWLWPAWSRPPPTRRACGSRKKPPATPESLPGPGGDNPPKPGQSYRIKQISVGQSGGVQPMPMLRGKMAMAAEAAPCPWNPAKARSR